MAPGLFPSFGQLLVALGVAYVSSLSYFLYKGYYARRQYKLLKERGMVRMLCPFYLLREHER